MPPVHLDRLVVRRHHIAARGPSRGVRETSWIAPAYYHAATRRPYQLPQQTLCRKGNQSACLKQNCSSL